MTRAPADYREFIRVSVDLPANPKLAVIDDPAAGWAYVVSLCYCGQHLTDGSFPMPAVLRLSGVKRTVPRRLIEAGLWHETGHSCDRCPQPMKGMAVVHDYLVHQRSAEEAKTLRDARREAGRRGAESRWGSNGDGKSHSNSDGNRHSNSHGTGEANGMATGQQGFWQSDGTSMAEVEVEEEKNPPYPPGGAITADAATGVGADFETWWAQWPRKIAKQKAFTSYRAARKKKIPADVLLSTAAQQLAAWRAAGRALDKVPHATTWLNQERWNDVVEKPKLTVVTPGDSPWAEWIGRTS